ncbi:hypothetical protein ACUXIS_003621, partial [Cytobacillus horneckiae]
LFIHLKQLVCSSFRVINFIYSPEAARLQLVPSNKLYLFT